MDRLKFFKSEFNTQGRRVENDYVSAFGRWAIREHFVSGAYLWKYLSNYFWFRTMTYLEVLTHTSFPELISKSTGSITFILHIHVL